MNLLRYVYMSFGLSKRFLRAVVYTIGFFATASALLFFANQHNYIDINRYIPYYLTPTFFQPSSDLYIIDISVKKCLKFNGNNPLCGVPGSAEGANGDLGVLGGWNRVDKDLTLGSSFLHKQFFSYKILKHDAFQNGQLDESLSNLVITDIAVYNPEVDGKIPGNNMKLPQKILEEFRKSDVYDDEDQIHYENHGVKGELSKEDSYKHKASLGNKVVQDQIDQKEKEALGKEDETAIKDKQKDKQKEKDTQKQKQKQKTNEESEKQKAKKETKPKSEPKVKLESRKVEERISDLNIHYEIPTQEQLDKSGWKHKSNGIWCKFEYYSTTKAITGIDILFGKDAVEPRPNWNIIKDAPVSGINPSKGREPYLTFRRGAKVDYKSSKYQKPLKIDKQGKFKILQVADLHFSTGVGKCRDPAPDSTAKGCEADPRTLKFLEKVLDIETPDLVVLTGDQIFGDEAPDSESALFKAVYPFITRQIPFAATLGNHDDEGSIPRNEMMSLISNLPYSLAANGPEEVSGIGNYVISVQGSSPKSSALLLYLLDTHKYSQNPKVNPGYDWIKDSQLMFAEREYSSFKTQIESFPNYHMSMAFFHIPLPEYRNLDQAHIGEKREGITAPKYNTHARTKLGELGVKAISVGHDHCNDYCLLDNENSKELNSNKMWLCYGGGSGEGGYGGYGGYIRRLRSFEFDTTKGEITTWKRLESDPETKVDKQVIVSLGEVVNFKG
ncbi:Metallo-dependent phosphatase [Yamadazyma tenuis ATCC 10573]|uniref:Metallo-dependent phosphatase n=1 Tax=Candida tenuis (strain ATCC 10573 / BCRC 21748 / CBS 615 / JCM 9827 / NBRC 10315 / NRRL Y-1498 / VKM Y-70) TaxID=590646 RepID=G3B1K6_CANTC|nr:Metallo-dependent phosphatase [Yamadazyma tenuis ATCC 10573]EGV64467.1 Metallo-dependent phosphatase [Yamadazyma tenuis ATCC 10573]